MSESPEVESGRLEPLDEAVEHGGGDRGGVVVLDYGGYACPYSRAAYLRIEVVEPRLAGSVRFAFRHFPLVDIHPHALAASGAAEAAASQGRFWEMHDRLFHGR